MMSRPIPSTSGSLGPRPAVAMSRSLRLVAAAFCLSMVWTHRAGAVVPIGTLHCNDASGQSLHDGQTVTVRGTVTADFPTGTTSRFYIDDGTGGILVFGGSIACPSIGTFLEVTGTIDTFNGLTEITTPGLTITNLGMSSSPEPVVTLTPAGVNATYQGDQCEPNESRLVHLEDVYVRFPTGTMPFAGATYGANSDYRLISAGPDSATNFCSLRIMSSGNDCAITNPLVGRPINRGASHCVIGILSQFDATSPYTSAYQVLPRLVTDLEPRLDIATLAGVWEGPAAWGDYDGDGDLDVVVGGYDGSAGTARVYRNSGGVFTVIANLTGIYGGDADWGDYDQDGDLDLLITGWMTAGRVGKLYDNLGNGSFVENSSAGLPAVGYSSTAWGDYDNDGDLDLALTGRWEASVRIAKIFENQGGTFAENTAATLTGVSEGSVAWGDYDVDGDLDLLLTGHTGTVSLAKLYENLGGGAFIENSGAALPGVRYSAVAWGDYDSDGDLDLLLAGVASGGEITRVYENQDGSLVENTAAVLTGVSHSSGVAWGDHDNDGDLDILLVGYTGSTDIAKIYLNQGGGAFTEDSETALTGVLHAAAAWGDHDGDGDLDIVIAGMANSTGLTRVYRVGCVPHNTPPSAPVVVLTTSGTGTQRVTLRWGAGNDAETPAAGLTYNLRVGTTPGGSEVVSAMASPAGHRWIAGIGNAGHNLEWTLDLAPGTYYWTVQTIDGAFAGSPFAPEQTLVFDPPLDAGDGPGPPVAFALGPTQPNPFHARTTVSFDLPHESEITLRIHDLHGRLVQVLARGSWPAGRHQVPWDGTVRSGEIAPGGVYFCVLEAEGLRAQHRIVRLR